MHHFSQYKETQFAIKVHHSKMNTEMKLKKEFKLRESRVGQGAVKFEVDCPQYRQW